MTIQPIKNLRDINDLSSRLAEAQEAVKYAQALKTAIEQEIVGLFADSLAEAYKEKGTPFGVVNLEKDGVKVAFTTDKKVTYDQDMLAKLYADGAPVEVKYNVKETVFNSMSKTEKEFFMPARTVTPGKVSIEIKGE